MAEKRNQEIRDFCDWDYPHWLNSRRHYAKALPINILAQFQPSKTPIERDYDNSPFCAAFHLSLQLSIDRERDKATCFLYVFFPKARPEPIKTLAFKLGINKDTANEWAHETAINVFRLARIQCQMYDMFRDDKFTF